MDGLKTKDQVRFKKILLEERERILNNSKESMKQDLSISSDDLPDETDLAATEISQSLVFKLRDRERLMLAKISEALIRIDEGTFGICQECEEPIEMKRLEARPISTFCLACKEKQEHREKIYA